ncbi:MAG: putative ABC transporter permease [Huintestinicola sp.]
MIEQYDMYSLGIMMAVISFLGFCLENIWLAVTRGYVDNRNMSMPFLIGYGLLVVAMYLLFGTPENMILLGSINVKASKRTKILIYFICAAVIVSIAEIVLGTAMENLCGFEYWNYTWIPLHITKYTSVPTSIGFAAVITMFMGECFTPLMRLITQLDHITASFLSIALVSIMAADFLSSFLKMYRTRSLNLRWKKELKHYHSHSAE